MHYAESFSFIKGSVYKYVNRTGSQSNIENEDPWGNVANALRERILQMNLYEKYADTINAFITTATIISLKKIAEKYYWKDYKILSKVRLKKYKKDMDNTYPVDTAHMGTKARVLFPFLKAEFIAPIYLACCINKVMRNK